MAEDTGLIVPIGQWVLDEACAQCARWREHGPLTMAVNLSARQLAEPDLAATVEATLARHAVAPGDLVLELTESLVVTDDARTRAAFAALRALGVRLAIDDFGTGYASLSALKHFPADVLKIDRSFVEGLGAGGIDDKIVAAVVGLARDLGLLAVAEGVETVEQAAALRALGCELAQGYLFARPGPAAGIDALLAAAPPA
jgi:diguanylate cyclase